jgi:GNAT superfamily N-acetyltransferase
MTLDVRPVADRAGIEHFLDVPRAVYGGEPGWRPPFRHIERRKLLPGRHPFHAAGEAAFWTASRAGRPVGRVAAMIDPRHLARHGATVGQFGLLAAENDAATFGALFAAAEDWLLARGMTDAQGPYSLTINEEVGLPIEGCTLEPMTLMPFAPAYVGARLEQLAYAVKKRLLVYRWSAAAMACVPAVPAPDGVALRVSTRARLRGDIAAAMEIYNDGWSGHWGHISAGPAEVAAFYAQCGRYLDPALVVTAEHEGRPVGIALTVPDFNEVAALYDAPWWRCGRARATARLALRRVGGGRLMLIGLRQGYRGRGLGRALLGAAAAAWRRAGLERAEVSWVLEDNVAMRSLCERHGGVQAQVCAIFARRLAGPRAAGAPGTHGVAPRAAH